MGIADRDYHRSQHRRVSGFFSQLTPVVKWLLALNLGIYLLDTLLKGEMDENGPLRTFGAFAIETAIYGGRIWEFLTFQFLHGSLGHVLFNCLGIFFFGPWLERWWGSQKFLLYYLLCGVGGGLFFTLLTMLHLLPETWVPLSAIPDAETVGLTVRNGMVLLSQPMVGASAGIYGILIGVAVVAPGLRVALLFPPIELSMRQLALALLAIAVGTIIFKFGNEGGQAGHLGGAFMGFLLMRYPWMLGHGERPVLSRRKADFPPPAAKLRPRTQVDTERVTAVDAILDKISKDGFQSLTDEEREFLQRASNHHKTP